MSNQQLPTVASWMRGFFPRYIIVLTLLWMVVLNVADLLPKEGDASSGRVVATGDAG